MSANPEEQEKNIVTQQILLNTFNTNMNNDSSVDMTVFETECPDLARVFNQGNELQGKFKIDLKWESVNYKINIGNVKGKKEKEEQSVVEILNGVSGRVQPGEVVGIMGSSGSGKTSLLNVLAGRISVGEITGDIRVNERKRGNYWRKLIGYVEQSDIMHGKLTVRETIMYSALLRLPNSMSRKDKMSRVDAVIAQLGLTHVQDSFVGDDETRGVSGGERKRVAIGIELVTNPRLIFLDEPTSGLDAFTAYNLIESLSELAKKDDKTVLLTIHQPRSNILDLFDKILLLSKGQVVFFGPAKDALEHFDSLGYKCPNLENPADFFLDITAIDYRNVESTEETRKRVQFFADKWKELPPLFKSTPLLSSEESRKRTNRVSILSEIWLLLGRDFTLVLRDKQQMFGTLLQIIVFIVLFGGVYFQLDDDYGAVQNRTGILFILSANAMFNTVMPLVLVFPVIKNIIKRERYGSMYRVSSILIASFVSNVPLRFSALFLSMTGIYFLAGLQLSRYYIFMCTLFLNSLCSISIGLMIGSLSRTPKQSQIFAPLVLIIFLLFGGNFANNETITWAYRWIQYISLIYYSYSALITNEFTGKSFGTPAGVVPGSEILISKGITVSIGQSLITLSALTLLFSFFAYIFLRQSTRPVLKLK